MEKKIQSGECWKLKSNPNYIVMVERVLFGKVVYTSKDGKKDKWRKVTFLDLFEYSHYVPTHQEMG